MAFLIKNDPSMLAEYILNAVQGDSDFVTGNNHAYSIVLGQDSRNSYYYGYVCEVGTNHFYTTTALSQGYGNLLLFQTR